MVRVVDLTANGRHVETIQALAALGNALAVRGLGHDSVVVLAPTAAARGIAEALGADDAERASSAFHAEPAWTWDGDHWRAGAFAHDVPAGDAQPASAPCGGAGGDGLHLSADAGAAPRPTRSVAWARVSAERATWVSLDLDAVASNVRAIRTLVGPDVGVMAVVKANAYGHGSASISRAAIAAGARALGVAALIEGITLREEGIAEPILVLGYTPPWQADEVVRYGIAVAVASLDVVASLGQAAARLGGSPATVHVKVDTGMGRLGMPAERALDFVRQASEVEGVEIEGIFTHFATADWADQTESRHQLARFNAMLTELEAGRLRPGIVHAANTAAMLTLPEARFDMVRLGIGMYGLDPSPDVPCPVGFRPALRFTTTVAQVKDLPPGHGVSYGRTYVTSRPTRIAVLPVGYGDGFRRSPRNWGSVLIRGEFAPIVGVVCMDMCMVDVSHINGVAVGDEVVLLGEQGDRRLTAEEVAERLGTINYEVVTQILARVPREAWAVSDGGPGGPISLQLLDSLDEL
jgi:alanine racemase